MSLYVSDAAQKALAELVRTGKNSGLKEVGERLLRIDPGLAAGWMMIAQHYRQAGELPAAADAAWNGLRAAPCDPTFYLLISGLDPSLSGASVLPWHCVRLALRCASLSLAIPEEVKALAAAMIGDGAEDLDTDDPLTFEALAAVWEDRRPEEIPAEPPGELQPFDLLTRFRIQAHAGKVDPELIEAICEHAAGTVPLFHAALRQWARNRNAIEPLGLHLVCAVLGELGGADAAADLLELCGAVDEGLDFHANWAIWRAGQRMPEAVLAAIDAFAGTATLPARCACAEHLSLLPDSVDIEPAVLKLMRGFEKFARREDAAYLIVAAGAALVRRGRERTAERIVREYYALLKGKGRREMEHLTDNDDFIPRLIQENIAGPAFEEVCIERVLMPEEDSDEDYEKEEEDEGEEEAAPQPPRYKPERNSPCWCGSGKKYKKCHLQEDEAASQPRMSNHERLLLEVAQAAAQWQSKADAERAGTEYFGNRRHEATTEAGVAFMQWMIRNFRDSNGETPIVQYLRRRGAQLSEEDRRMLESWRDGRYGLYEVQRVEPKTGVELKDWFTGERYYVHDKTASMELSLWDVTLSRVERAGERWEFSGDGVLAPRTVVSSLLELIEAERRGTGLSAAEWVRANSNRLHRDVLELATASAGGPALVNTDNEPLVFSAALYDVADEAAARAALRGISGFEENGEEFHWSGAAGLGSNTSLGRIEFAQGSLRLECNSRERLARGKKLIEEAAGPAIRYRKDEYEAAKSALSRHRAEPGEAAPAKPVPPEVEREIIGKFLDDHYGKWPDTALPALGGHTPREAVRTPDGRETVLRLIHDFENSEERARRAGRSGYDFSRLRDELGLGRE